MGCNGRRGVKASPINPANKQSGGGVGTENKSTRSEARGGSDKRHAVWLTAQWEIQRGDNKAQGSHKRWNQQHTETTCISYKNPRYASNQSLWRTVSHNAKLLRDDVYEEWMRREKAPALLRLQSGDTKQKPADLFSSSQDPSRRLMFISVNVVIIQMNHPSPSQGDMLLWAVLAASC